MSFWDCQKRLAWLVAENTKLRADLAGVRADLEIAYASSRKLESEQNALRDDLARTLVALARYAPLPKEERDMILEKYASPRKA